MLQAPILRVSSQLFLAGITCLSFLGNEVVVAQTTEPTLATLQQQPVPPLEDSSIYLPEAPVSTHLVLNLTERQVHVLRNGEVHVSYPVAVGREGWETPTGEFEILQMIKDPSWEHPWTGEIVPPGANNPLGQRWIGFWTDGNNYIGFHGTPDESVIGQAVSHGCVRMRNDDVAELFQLVDLGTVVVVQP